MNYFANSTDHLLAELERLDILLSIQVWRVRQTNPKEDQLNAFFIAEAEVDRLLAQPIGMPRWSAVQLPDEDIESVQQKLDTLADQIESKRVESYRRGIGLRLDQLCILFNLSVFDRDVLLMALAPEIDLRYQRLYAYLQDDMTRKDPTIELSLNLLCPPIETKLSCRARFAPTAPLFKEQLLAWGDPRQAGSRSELAQSFALTPRIRRYLFEDETPDLELAPYYKLEGGGVGWHDLPFPAGFTTEISTYLSAHELAAPHTFYLQGPPGSGRARLAQAIATHLERPLLTIHGQPLAQLPLAQFQQQVTSLLREVQLYHALIYWEDFGVLQVKDRVPQLNHLLREVDGRVQLLLLAGERSWQPASGQIQGISQKILMPTLTATEREACWINAVGERGRRIPIDMLQEVNSKHRLTIGQIEAAVETAQQFANWRDPSDPSMTVDDLLAGARQHANQALADLAQKITPQYRWDDIVLSAPLRGQLREICDQIHYRDLVYQTWGFEQKLAMGKGVNALFSGPPGTGKTMAADIIAGELGLDLYKIDLSTVVSKYIGETEKNLAEIFTEAETSNAILFFDEADALFGKRTEVKDSHDRYANLEISYLLQRIEHYGGIVILASNFRKNMDEAFVRRMHFILEFPFPGPAERLKIWEKIWPVELPLSAQVDNRVLAEKIELAGGHIRNVALTAAFLAAANGGQVTLEHLSRATQGEYQKMGKVLHQAFDTR